MFELIVAWSVFTYVMGKGAESAIHAWKGTAPPAHERRMARIRARQSASEDGLDSGGPAGRGRRGRGAMRAYLADVWDEKWIEAAQRRSERSPERAERARERARIREQVWAEWENTAQQRWDQRRWERAEGELNRIRQELAGARKELGRARQDEKQARLQAQLSERDADQSASDARAERALAKAEKARRSERAEERARRAEQAEKRAASARELARELRHNATYQGKRRQAAQQVWDRLKGRAPAQDQPEGAEKAQEKEDPPAQENRTEQERPQGTAPEGETDQNEGGGQVLPFPAAVNTGDENEQKEQDMSEQNNNGDGGNEVLGLDGSLAFAQHLEHVSQTNMSGTEQAVAAMERGNVGASITGRGQQVMEALDALTSLASAWKEDMERMKTVQEAYDATPDAGDKDFVTGGR